jgi:hypothetical protein
LINFNATKKLEDFEFVEHFDLYHPIILKNFHKIQIGEKEILGEDTIEELNEEKEDTPVKCCHFEFFDPSTLSIEGIHKNLEVIQAMFKNEKFIESKELNFLDSIHDYIVENKKKIILQFSNVEMTSEWPNQDIHSFEKFWKISNECISILNKLFDNHQQYQTIDLKTLSELKRRKEMRNKRNQQTLEEENKYWNELKFKNEIDQLFFFIQKFGFIGGKKYFCEWNEISDLNETADLYSTYFGVNKIY